MEFSIAGSLFFLSPKGTLVMGEDEGKKRFFDLGWEDPQLRVRVLDPLLRPAFSALILQCFIFKESTPFEFFFLQDIKGV